jgi:hypothetical protein
MFQLTSPLPGGQAIDVIDLDKVCRLRVEDLPDAVRVRLWFVGGLEVEEEMDRDLARQLLDAFADFLRPSS